MDDDDLPRRRDDVLAALIKQPLDPLSVDELGERIEVLQAEKERVKASRSAATRPKAAAEALFRKGDRKTEGTGKSVEVRGGLGGRRIMKKKTNKTRVIHERTITQ